MVPSVCHFPLLKSDGPVIWMMFVRIPTGEFVAIVGPSGSGKINLDAHEILALKRRVGRDVYLTGGSGTT